jgi:hypothetical protein
MALAPIHGPPQKRRKTVRTVSALMVTGDAGGAAVPATDLRIGGPGDHGTAASTGPPPPRDRLGGGGGDGGDPGRRFLPDAAAPSLSKFPFCLLARSSRIAFSTASSMLAFSAWFGISLVSARLSLVMGDFTLSPLC